MKGVSVATVWFACYWVLSRYGVYLLPTQLARKMTFGEYLAAVQLTSTIFGLMLILVLTRHQAHVRRLLVPLTSDDVPRESRLSDSPLVRLLLVTLLLSPLLYVVAHSLGMYLAYDSLIAELAQYGLRAVQQQTGELGHSARGEPLWLVLPLTLFIAPLSEELLFRGAIFGAVQSFFLRSDSIVPDSTPSSLKVAGLPPRKNTGRAIVSFARRGGWAWLFSSLIFGAMHADTPGGMGIMRVTSASVLGLACGYMKMTKGTLIVPLVLHVGYNFFSLSTLRGWLVFDGWPTKYALPTILLLIAPIAMALALLLGLSGSRRRKVTTMEVD